MKSKDFWDFPGGPLVKNLPCNPGDMGLIPGLGTKIPQAVEQFSPQATTEPACHNQQAITREAAAAAAKSSLHTATKDPMCYN